MSKKAEAEALRFMQETEGWQLIEQHIKSRLADSRSKLEHCKSWDEVLQHRGGIEMLQSVLSYINYTIQKAKEDEEQ